MAVFWLQTPVDNVVVVVLGVEIGSPPSASMWNGGTRPSAFRSKVLTGKPSTNTPEGYVAQHAAGGTNLCAMPPRPHGGAESTGKDIADRTSWLTVVSPRTGDQPYS